MSWSVVQGPHGNSTMGCFCCAVGDEDDCKTRWDYMRDHGGGLVNCWRPPGSILVWGEENEPFRYGGDSRITRSAV